MAGWNNGVLGSIISQKFYEVALNVKSSFTPVCVL